MLVDFTGGLSSLSHAATHSMSSLHLNSVQLTDNGNYTCQPSGLQKVRQPARRIRRREKPSLALNFYVCKKPIILYLHGQHRKTAKTAVKWCLLFLIRLSMLNAFALINFNLKLELRANASFSLFLMLLGETPSY